eukprot:5647230-Pleurochrysis_carterae.AAC.2
MPLHDEQQSGARLPLHPSPSNTPTHSSPQQCAKADGECGDLPWCAHASARMAQNEVRFQSSVTSEIYLHLLICIACMRACVYSRVRAVNTWDAIVCGGTRARALLHELRAQACAQAHAHTCTVRADALLYVNTRSWLMQPHVYTRVCVCVCTRVCTYLWLSALSALTRAARARTSACAHACRNA